MAASLGHVFAQIQYSTAPRLKEFAGAVLAATVSVAFVLCGPFAPTPEDKERGRLARQVSGRLARQVSGRDARAPATRTDALGDPLPPWAVARLGSLRLYHGQQMRHVELSPDGKWVVSRADEGNRLWDAATGRESPLRAELRQAAVFATRDKLLAVQRAEKSLHLWDVAAGKEVARPLAVGEMFMVAFALSPDGKTLVLARLETNDFLWTLRFCDFSTGKIGEPVRVLKKGEQIANNGFAFSADGKTLVLQYLDTSIHVWDMAERCETKVAPANPKFGLGFTALSPDGRILATGPFADKRIYLWDTRTFKELPPLVDQPNEVVQPIAFSPDGKLLAVTYPAPTVRLWDLATRKQVRSLRGKSFQVFHTVFSADGQYLAAADGCEVTFWDLATGKFRHDFNFGHTYSVDSVAFSPDGKKLVSGAAYTDTIVRVWDPLTGKQTSQLRGHKEGIEVVAYAPDGKRIASASQDGTIRLWDAATGREIHRLEAKDGMVYAMAFAPDGKTLASGGRRKAVHLWDAATGRELRSFANPGAWILRLAFSPDGKWLATRGFDEKAIRLWDVAKGETIRQLAAPAAGCTSLQFSPDGTLLAAGGDDAAVHCWDVRSGAKLRRFAFPLEPGHFSRVLSVAFSPDGRSLAAGYDSLVRLWEVASGQERLRFEGHRNSVGSLAFSPDGTLLASGGSDRIVMVWDVTGQRTMPLLSKGQLRAEESNALWRALADADAGKAYRAMQTLRAAPEQAAALLKQHLHPAAALDARHMDRLIADLDSDQFQVREKAAHELRQMGDNAEPMLRKILAGKPSAEQRLRVRALLQAIDAARSPQRLRDLRAVEVLEWLGSAEARQTLQILAGGGAHAPRTRAAKSALERLAKQARP